MQTEFDGLRQTHDKVFQTLPIEWIEEKLSQFRELLEVNTNDSVLGLSVVDEYYKRIAFTLLPDFRVARHCEFL